MFFGFNERYLQMEISTTSVPPMKTSSER